MHSSRGWNERIYNPRSMRLLTDEKEQISFSSRLASPNTAARTAGMTPRTEALFSRKSKGSDASSRGWNAGFSPSNESTDEQQRLQQQLSRLERTEAGLLFTARLGTEKREASSQLLENNENVSTPQSMPGTEPPTDGMNRGLLLLHGTARLQRKTDASRARLLGRTPALYDCLLLLSTKPLAFIGFKTPKKTRKTLCFQKKQRTVAMIS